MTWRFALVGIWLILTALWEAYVLPWQFMGRPWTLSGLLPMHPILAFWIVVFPVGVLAIGAAIVWAASRLFKPN